MLRLQLAQQIGALGGMRGSCEAAGTVAAVAATVAVIPMTAPMEVEVWASCDSNITAGNNTDPMYRCVCMCVCLVNMAVTCCVRCCGCGETTTGGTWEHACIWPAKAARAHHARLHYDKTSFPPSSPACLHQPRSHATVLYTLRPFYEKNHG